MHFLHHTVPCTNEWVYAKVKGEQVAKVNRTLIKKIYKEKKT